jgi:predicted nucleic-acid-binding protein
MENGKADFSDYFITKINLDAGCSETVTFDAKLKGTEGIRLFK